MQLNYRNEIRKGPHRKYVY